MSEIARLILEQGRIAGDARRRKGELWGNAVSQIAQVPGNIYNQRLQEKAQQQQIDRQGRMDAIAAQTAGDNHTAALSEAEDRKRQIAADEAGKLRDAGYPQAETAAWIQSHTAKGDLWTPEEGLKLIEKVKTPEGTKAVLDFMAPKQAAVTPRLMQVNPEFNVIDENTREVVQTGTPKPVEAQKVTFAAPQFYLVNGKKTLVRPGSDGALYLNPTTQVDPKASVEPLPPAVSATSDDPGPLETIIGPDGKPMRVARKDAIGKAPASGTAKPATGLEKRALAFYNRAAQADKDIEDMEPQIQALNLGGQALMAFMPNFMQTELGQQYRQAQRAFTEARLRKDSGAAIPKEEFANDQRTYFAMPGDSNATLEQKRRARAAILASLGFESGQALGEFMGDPEEAANLVQGYKTRANKTVADVPAEVSAVLKGASVGRHTLSDGSVWMKHTDGSITK